MIKHLNAFYCLQQVFKEKHVFSFVTIQKVEHQTILIAIKFYEENNFSIIDDSLRLCHPCTKNSMHY